MNYIVQKRFLFVVYLILTALVLVYINSQIVGSEISGDASQNLRMSYHLYSNNTISNDGVSPTNYREPVPIIATSIYFSLRPSITKDVDLQSLQNGEHTRTVRQFNLLWVLLLLIGVGLLSYILSNNQLIPFLVFILVLVYMIRFYGGYYTLNTELLASTLMIWTSIFLIKFVEKRSYIYGLLTGILCGLLILTKAVFLYILPLLILMLIVYNLFFTESNDKNFKKGLSTLIVFIFGVTMIVAPWLIRNKVHFGSYEITQRGGTVLYIRATYNKMTFKEAMASFSYWGPYSYQVLSEEVFNGPKQSDFEEGGRYQKINRDGFRIGKIAEETAIPDLAVAYRKKVHAEQEKLQLKYSVLGFEDTKKKSDEFFIEKAKGMILEKPFKHLAMSVPFFWRGVWCFPNSTIPFMPDNFQRIIHDIINLLAYLSFIYLLIVSLLKRDFKLIAFFVLPMGMLLFYALFSHNIPRYNEPAIPFLLISFAIVLSQFFFKIISNFFPNNEIIELP